MTRLLAALAVLGMLAACQQRKPPSPPAEAALPAPKTVPPEPDVSGSAPALFHDNSAHPWNQVHQALLACPPAMGLPVQAALLAEGGDTSTLLLHHDVLFLGRAPRAATALRAVRAVLSTDPTTNFVAAALLQHDLWERFDEINETLRQGVAGEPATTLSALAELQGAVGQALRTLALPSQTLRALTPNRGQAARAYPALLGGIDSVAWVEVIARSRDKPEGFSDNPVRDGTRHAQLAGYRSAFRRLLSIPTSAGGAQS